MSGEDFSATERLVRFIIRRAYTFLPDLTFFADFKSSVFQFQDDNGRVVQFLPTLDSPLLGSYAQVGNRLDMVFSLDTGRSVTMYVSKDGSIIHGTLITHRSDFDEDTKITETFGVTRHWVLIEKGDNECLGEIIQ